MLAVLAVFLGPIWFAALLLVWAPLVSLARVSMGVHYLSDVAAGLILGLMIGMLVGLLLV
jgi:undecaprenyl-diphosphatase